MLTWMASRIGVPSATCSRQRIGPAWVTTSVVSAELAMPVQRAADPPEHVRDGLAATRPVAQRVGGPGVDFGPRDGGPGLALPSAEVHLRQAVICMQRRAGLRGHRAGDVLRAGERAGDDALD